MLSPLSIVIPAYNEQQRLGKTLDALQTYFRSRPRALEVIIVDDGSTDNTRMLAAGYARRWSACQLLHYPHNQGKGRAVAYGVAAAKKPWILLYDADGATPITELSKLERHAARGTIIIGSRHINPALVQRHPGWSRRWQSRLANFLVRSILLPHIKDTQCGFKLYKTELAKKLFRTLKAPRFGFDFEILAAATADGHSIIEVPVRWTNQPGTKVSAFAALQTMYELVRVRMAYGPLELPSSPSAAHPQEVTRPALRAQDSNQGQLRSERMR